MPRRLLARTLAVVALAAPAALVPAAASADVTSTLEWTLPASDDYVQKYGYVLVTEPGRYSFQDRWPNDRTYEDARMWFYDSPGLPDRDYDYSLDQAGSTVLEAGVHWVRLSSDDPGVGGLFAYGVSGPGPLRLLGVGVDACDGVAPVGYTVVRGTEGADRLTGTTRKELFLAGGGDDRIDAGGGDDIVCAGDGDDVVDGGSGHDRLFGGPGDDRLEGGSGNDELHADDLSGLPVSSVSADTLLGGSGNDELHAGRDGGAGDRLVGDAGTDTAVAAGEAVLEKIERGIALPGVPVPTR